MKTLFFDTETTGIHATARITQLAWALYDGKTLVRKHCTIIRPDGWEVPTEKFFLDHNMSTERCEREGIAIADALQPFIYAYNETDLLVAHNIDFDRRMINYEFTLADMRPNAAKPNICTMKTSVAFCKLPGKYDYKWPRLDELHAILFGNAVTDAHDAGADVEACARCFFELSERGVINVTV